jgi:hypothetical protein
MRVLIALLFLTSTAFADDPCTTQDYSNAKKEPRYDCPGPGEGALVPDIPTKPTIGLERGAKITTAGKKSKTFKLEYDSALVSRGKLIELGMKIKGLRRLRWADMHKGAERLEIERKFIDSTWKAKLTLRDSQLSNAKQQIVQAQKDLEKAKKWYRSWTFGLVVGVVTTTAAVIGTALAVR